MLDNVGMLEQLLRLGSARTSLVNLDGRCVQCPSLYLLSLAFIFLLVKCAGMLWSLM